MVQLDAGFQNARGKILFNIVKKKFLESLCDAVLNIKQLPELTIGKK